MVFLGYACNIYSKSLHVEMISIAIKTIVNFCRSSLVKASFLESFKRRFYWISTESARYQQSVVVRRSVLFFFSPYCKKLSVLKVMNFLSVGANTFFLE